MVAKFYEVVGVAGREGLTEKKSGRERRGGVGDFLLLNVGPTLSKIIFLLLQIIN